MMDEVLESIGKIATAQAGDINEGRTGLDWALDVRSAIYEAEGLMRAGRPQDAEDAWMRAGALCVLATHQVRESAAL